MNWDRHTHCIEIDTLLQSHRKCSTEKTSHNSSFVLQTKNRSQCLIPGSEPCVFYFLSLDQNLLSSLEYLSISNSPVFIWSESVQVNVQKHRIIITSKSFYSALFKSIKTARIRAKPWMFRMPFKVYGAIITIKIKWIETKSKFFF